MENLFHLPSIESIEPFRDSSRSIHSKCKIKNESSIIIILSSDDEIDTHSNAEAKEKNGLVGVVANSEQINEDDVQFVQVKSFDGPTYYNYFDGGLANEQEVKQRWRSKTLPDPKINLSKSNYRKRLFKINDPLPNTRIFLACLLGKKLPNRFEEIKSMDDKKVLDEKISEIHSHFGKLIESNEAKLSKQERNLHDAYVEKRRRLRIDRESKYTTLNMFGNRYQIYQLAQELRVKHDANERAYKDALANCRFIYEEESQKLRESCNLRVNALQALYASGKYEKGRLGEYFSLVVNQGLAIRRDHIDDDQRHILLHEDKLKFILIEDLIYSHFYASK